MTGKNKKENIQETLISSENLEKEKEVRLVSEKKKRKGLEEGLVSSADLEKDREKKKKGANK